MTDTAREREIQRILASDPDYARDTDITKRAERVEKMPTQIAPSAEAEYTSKNRAAKDLISGLSPREQKVLRMKLGAGGGGGMMPDLEGLKGRKPKLYKKGGAVKSASSRADGIAQRGKTRGMMR